MKNRHTQYAREERGSCLWMEGFLQEGDEASQEGWATEDLEQDC